MKPLKFYTASLCAAAFSATAASEKPNIIVILADDMGFSDIGCYGGEISTPNLDRLAANGLRFTQFYNAGRCCPTRASLLTGLYPHQAGIGHMTENQSLPGYEGRLNEHCVTLAEVLKTAGYFTAMSGKWHVGQNQGVTPWDRGFDRSLNSVAGGFYFSDAPKAKLYLNGALATNGCDGVPGSWYSTDLWTDFGIKFIDEARAEKKPFFLYLPHNAPHFPLQAPEADIARWRGKYKAGWDILRTQRYARQIELGIIDPSWPLAPKQPDVQNWDSLTPGEQDRFDHIMAIYAAVVEHMDMDIGRLIDALRQRGELDNTLIFFLSDNGGNAESGPDGKLIGKNPGNSQSTVFEGESWATLSNTPFRLYKHYNHEGGISTPLIAHWPARIKSGGLCGQPGHLIDIMATCIDVSGAAYPSTVNGSEILPPEGKSLVPAFDNRIIERSALYWEHEGNAAIRTGNWKLVRKGRNGAWELYNMKADRTEQNDLSATEPERTQQLIRQWNEWAKRAHVLPAPVEKKGQKKKSKKAPKEQDEEK